MFKFISRITKSFLELPPLVLLAYLICMGVWSYLLIVTEPIIIWDSVSYEELGRLIYQEGWVSYFKTGPHREAGYALLISVSMRLADLSGHHYLDIQRLFQIMLLFLSLLCMHYIYIRLKIRPSLCALGILYLGLSPGILNSSLILYYEAVTYPFVLFIAITYAHLFSNLHSSTRSCILSSIALSLAYLYLTMVKGVFEPLSYLYFLPLLAMLVISTRLKNRALQKNLIISLAMIFLFSYLPVTLFKTANKAFNGEYTLSDRGASTLFTSTLPRVKAVDGIDLLALAAHIPGQTYCLRFFNNERCDRWEWWDAFAKTGAEVTDQAKRYGLKEPLTHTQITSLTLRMILRHPLRYSTTTFIHGFKLFVWEYFYGFVAYPDWIDRIFLDQKVAGAFMFVSSILALISFTAMGIWCINNLKHLTPQLERPSYDFYLKYALFYLLFLFMLLSSLFIIINRYVLVIAPIYIILIIVFLDHVIKAWESFCRRSV